MTRIIAGRAGGRRLATPKGHQTRPTSDRVREALFSAIDSWAGTWSGLHVLDLYAGSGALGLEAWSRGASRVTLVESDRRTCAVISANARALGAAEAEVMTGSVAAVLARPPAARYDLVLADPPYPLSTESVEADLGALAHHSWLNDEALVVVERSVRASAPRWPVGFGEVRERRYGETMLVSALWYGRADQPQPGSVGPAQEDRDDTQ